MKLLRLLHIVDLHTFDWCLHRKHRSGLIILSRYVSKSADGYLYMIAALVFALTTHWQIVKFLFAGYLLERPLYFLLKNILKRNRPQQTIPGFKSVIQPSDQFSFPSGHTSAAFFFMGVISFFYPVLVIPFLLWAITVGVSRVMLGVHFPSDIAAGALLGYGISQFIILNLS